MTFLAKSMSPALRSCFGDAATMRPPAPGLQVVALASQPVTDMPPYIDSLDRRGSMYHQWPNERSKVTMQSQG